MTTFYTIGVKIQIKPGADLREEIAFCRMLTDLIKAALADNIFHHGEISFSMAPLPSGYLVFGSVVNLPDGLTTMRRLLERYDLFRVSEIVCRCPAGSSFHHHAGLQLGPFESHIQEAISWQKQLEEMHSKLNP